MNTSNVSSKKNSPNVSSNTIYRIKESSYETSLNILEDNRTGKLLALSDNSFLTFNNDIQENIENDLKIKNHYEDWVFLKEKNGKIKKYYAELNGLELLIFSSEKKSELAYIQNISGFFPKDGNSETKLFEKEKYYYFSLCDPFKKSKIYYFNNLASKKNLIENINIAIGINDITNYYEFIGELGNGLFGVVKKAIDKQNKKTVAIKIIEKTKLQLGEIYLIRNEIELLMHFQHPNIVRMYNSFETFENFFIIMEYLPEGDLHDFMESRLELPEKTIKNIIYSIANVVKYLNSYGAIHRDLKPQNIMLLDKNENPTIKLIDFGLTRITAQGEKLSEGFGTITYVAPEVLLRKPYNKQIDIWSLGVILYFLLSNGKLPFFDSTDDGICKKALLVDPAYPEEIFGKRSKSGILLINGCLDKDPGKRITIDGFLKHRWFSEK